MLEVTFRLCINECWWRYKRTLRPYSFNKWRNRYRQFSRWCISGRSIHLIVPEVNQPASTKQRYHCQSKLLDHLLVVPLKVLQDAYGLKRVDSTTYQAVSGSGMKGKKDLAEGVNGKKYYKHIHIQFIIMCYRILMCF